MVCYKHDLPVVILIVDHDLAQNVRALFLGFVTIQPNHVVRYDVPVFRNAPFIDNGIIGIVFETGDKIDAVICPGGKQFIIVISTIHDNDGAGSQRDFASHCDIE